MMKKLFYLTIISFIIISIFAPISYSESWNFNQSPVDLVSDINDQANKKRSNRVQNTDLDAVSSKVDCRDISTDSRFTITRTLCSIKHLSKDYLQYVMYIGLTAATIILIRNGFKIVTSSDRSKQMGIFKKNLRYIVIGVFLLIGFYYIIDLFVAVVNLISK